MNAVQAAAPNAQHRLDRRGVYIFLSRPGLMLGAITLIILLGSINYDNALGYLLSFLLAGMLMVAMLHTWRNLHGLRLLSSHARPVFVGETAQFECLFDNDTARTRLDLRVRYWPRQTSRQQRRYLRRFETVCNIEAHSSVAAKVAMDAEARGLMTLERIVIETRYPLGVLRAWAYFEVSAQCLVYPHPHGKLPLPGARDAELGERAMAVAGSDEFAGLRRYAPGDPVRAIAWKALARGEAVMVKRFQGQAAGEMCLSWEAVKQLPGLEARLSQLAAWVLAAHRKGTKFSLELPGQRIDFGSGKQHRDQCLAALALFSGTA